MRPTGLIADLFPLVLTCVFVVNLLLHAIGSADGRDARPLYRFNRGRGNGTYSWRTDRFNVQRAAANGLDTSIHANTATICVHNAGRQQHANTSHKNKYSLHETSPFHPTASSPHGVKRIAGILTRSPTALRLAPPNPGCCRTECATYGWHFTPILFLPGVRGKLAHPLGGEKVHRTFSGFRLAPR